MRAFGRATLYALAFVAAGSAAQASTIPVVTYSMNNGHGTEVFGDFNYLDQNYSNGTGAHTPGAFLSGGTGLLTNGVAPTTGYGAAPSQFIGWKYTDPLITFNLAQGFTAASIVLYVNGVFTGLSGPPSVIEVNNQKVSFTSSIHTCPGCSTAPGQWYNSKLTINLDPSLSDPDHQNQFAIQLFRGPYVDTENYAEGPYAGDPTYVAQALNGQNKYFQGQGLEPWIHLSEVEFLTGVPEPSTWILMALGFAGLGVFAQRKRRRHLGVA